MRLLPDYLVGLVLGSVESVHVVSVHVFPCELSLAEAYPVFFLHFLPGCPAEKSSKSPTMRISPRSGNSANATKAGRFNTAKE